MSNHSNNSIRRKPCHYTHVHLITANLTPAKSYERKALLILRENDNFLWIWCLEKCIWKGQDFPILSWEDCISQENILNMQFEITLYNMFFLERIWNMNIIKAFYKYDIFCTSQQKSIFSYLETWNKNNIKRNYRKKKFPQTVEISKLESNFSKSQL